MLLPFLGHIFTQFPASLSQLSMRRIQRNSSNSRKICIFCWRCHCHGIIYDYDTLLSSSKRERGKRRKNQPLLIFEDSTLYKYKLIFHPSLDIGQNTSPSTPTPTFISSLLSLSLTRRRLAAAAVREWMEENTWRKNPTLRKKEENIKKLFLEREKKRVLCVGPGKAEKSMGCRVRMGEW